MIEFAKNQPLVIKISLLSAVLVGIFLLFGVRINPSLKMDKRSLPIIQETSKVNKSIAKSSEMLAAGVYSEKEEVASSSAEFIHNPSVFSERLPILMYHYIESVPATTTLPNLYTAPSAFENQLQEIKNHDYKTISMSEAIASLQAEKPVAKGSLALTFDDGYEDFYTNAFPLLKKYEAKATLYVIINRLGTPGYLTRDQVREMAGSGLVEIGSHTFNHPDLRKLKEKNARFEIEDSRRILEQICGQKIPTFAYPYGYYNSEDLKLAAEAGYLGAVSVNPGAEQTADNLWLIKRLRPNSRIGEEFNKWLEDWLFVRKYSFSKK